MSTTVERVARALAEHDGVDLAVVFGSVARGVATEGSDLDLAVRGSADPADLAATLALTLGCEVDVVPLDTDDLVLLSHIVRDGQRVKERCPGSYGRFRARALATLETDLPLVRRQLDAFAARLARSGIPGLGDRS